MQSTQSPIILTEPSTPTSEASTGGQDGKYRLLHRTVHSLMYYRFALGPSSKKVQISWEKDGVAPHNKTSMDVLLDWLTTPGKYNQWRGSKNTPVASKGTLISEIAIKLAQVGITHRKTQDIRTKINNMQRDFAKAADWLSNTGSGVQLRSDNPELGEDEPQQQIKGIVLQLSISNTYCDQRHCEEDVQVLLRVGNILRR